MRCWMQTCSCLYPLCFQQHPLKKCLCGSSIACSREEILHNQRSLKVKALATYRKDSWPHIEVGASASYHHSGLQGIYVPHSSVHTSAEDDNWDYTAFFWYDTTVIFGWAVSSASKTRESIAAATLITSGCYCIACSHASGSPRYCCQRCSAQTMAVTRKRGAAGARSVAYLFDDLHNKDFQNIIITKVSRFY